MTDEPVRGAVERVRVRLRRMGARPGRRRLDLDDLVQETAASMLAHGAAPDPALWVSAAANKVRDRLRGIGRAPLEELGDLALDAVPRPRDEREATGPGPEAWDRLCRRAERLGRPARRVLAMRQGLDADWPTIGFLERRHAEAARSLFYRGRDGLRPRSDGRPARPN